MYPLILVVIAHTSCILAVSKSGRQEYSPFFWAWVVVNLVLSLSIYAPIVADRSAVFVLHISFWALALANLVFVIFWGHKEWLSVDPYIILVCVSFAIDYFRHDYH